jgi:Winged helix DNA-binding domain
VTRDEVHAARLTAQGLSTRPGKDPVAVAERLLAIQGQDGRGARLAVRARSEGVAASDIDKALADRKLIITWLNRGTLHLIRAEDYPMLQAVTTPPLWTSCRTRLRQTGVGEAAAERGVVTVAKALAEEGPLTRG